MRFVDDPLDDLKSGRAKLWMLLVGVNQYQDKQLTPLNFAVSDCQGLAEALKEATQRFPNQEVILHSSSAAPPLTLEAVRTSLEQIVNEANSQDTVLFYFSGHGIVEPASKQPFLCLEETQTENLHNTGLGLQELLQQLQLCGGKQLVLLDACHSGSIAHLWGGARGEAVEEIPPNPTRELAEVLQQCAAQSRGFCALLSCDEGQRSWEFPDLKHGVFTYYLMQGLQGEATDPRGMIEVNGLYKYVYDQTQRYVDSRMRQLHLPNPHNYQQTPRVIMSMAGDLVLGLKPEAIDLLQDYEQRLLEYRGKFNRAIQREFPLSQDTRQQLQRWQQEWGLRDEDIISTEARIIAVYEPKLQQYQQRINELIHQQYPLNQDTRKQLQLQQSLGLREEITEFIEAKVTQAYEQKLQQYEQAFTVAIHQQYPLSNTAYHQLQLQQSLEVREEITAAIAAKVTQAYEQKLQQYEEALTVAIHQQYPLSSTAYHQLQLQQSLEVREEIAAAIAAKVTQAYEQKLQQYEEALTVAIHQQYPLSNAAHQQLQLQQSLEVREEIAAAIAAKVTQAYEQKLQQYEEALTGAVQRQYPLSDDDREFLVNLRRVLDFSENQFIQGYEQKLQQYKEAFTRTIYQQYPLNNTACQKLHQLQQSLEIRKEITAAIAAQVTQGYERKLQQYKQAFTKAIDHQYPLNQDTCHQLKRLQQELGLNDNIVAEIEERITAPIEAERQRKLQQYEQAFTRAIQRQPLRDDDREVLEPLSDDDREVLEHYRQFLKFSEEITQSIEEQVTQAYKQKLHQYEQAFTSAIQWQYPLSNDARQPLQLLQQGLELSNEITESIAAKVTQAYEPKLQQYEKAFAVAIHQQYPFSDEARQSLQLLQQSLGLTEEITAAIETQVTQVYEQKLQQYEEAFTVAIHQEYPLSDRAFQPLQRLQRNLELRNAIAEAIAAKITQAYEQKLQQYEQAFTRAINQHYGRQ